MPSDFDQHIETAGYWIPSKAEEDQFRTEISETKITQTAVAEAIVKGTGISLSDDEIKLFLSGTSIRAIARHRLDALKDIKRQWMAPKLDTNQPSNFKMVISDNKTEQHLGNIERHLRAANAIQALKAQDHMKQMGENISDIFL